MKSCDIVVVGAGAAGLIAALEMGLTGKSVMVIEARERAGGRIHTVNDPSFEMPVEMGAEFIHGNLEPSFSLLEQSFATPYDVSGDIWQSRNGKIEELEDFIEDPKLLSRQFKKLEHDLPVADFIENYLQEDKFAEVRFTLRNYVEGYYAGDTLKSSTFALRDELEGPHETQYRAKGGYGKMVEYLQGECVKVGVQFFFLQVVREIRWKSGFVKVLTDDLSIEGAQALITVPLGVLQSEKIKFLPALPVQMSAARALGFGPVIKTILQFDEAFWKNKQVTQGNDLSKLSFIFSSAKIPTWWTYYPLDVAMITGWSGGPHAEEIKNLSDDEILHAAIESVAEVFDLRKPDVLGKLKSFRVANWVQDPFSCGAYSFDVVNGHKIKNVLTTPETNTIYFAGEGLVDGPEIGTVNGALVSGRETARKMIAAFKK
jgi:monoamine oxidase